MTLQEFFHRYIQAYSALDADSISQLFTMPLIAIHHGETTVYGEQDGEALRQATHGIMAYYRAQGATGADGLITEAQRFGDDVANVKLHWTVHRLDAEPWRFHTGYHLKRSQGEWRVYGVVQYDDHPN
ncbi:DUF4440 domain-containing protein [uncultured Aquitalea sp.]|uniref:DUF4440 domain-containing protein n=1 Tax=uncultured Aquitalea sp. TaxID=540272 RepID=UPI0025F11FAF|nr:DUF4440 domain-containing protein [uncultured Aquitalea sp.]